MAAGVNLTDVNRLVRIQTGAKDDQVLGAILDFEFWPMPRRDCGFFVSLCSVVYKKR
jgi:hypothetical protein